MRLECSKLGGCSWVQADLPAKAKTEPQDVPLWRHWDWLHAAEPSLGLDALGLPKPSHAGAPSTIKPHVRAGPSPVSLPKQSGEPVAHRGYRPDHAKQSHSPHGQHEQHHHPAHQPPRPLGKEGLPEVLASLHEEKSHHSVSTGKSASSEDGSGSGFGGVLHSMYNWLHHKAEHHAKQTAAKSGADTARPSKMKGGLFKHKT